MLSIFSWTSGPVWARTAQETATDIPSEQKADRHGRDSLISIHIRGRGGGHKAACHHQKGCQLLLGLSRAFWGWLFMSLSSGDTPKFLIL